jgi:hypothetical protein
MIHSLWITIVTESKADIQSQTHRILRMTSPAPLWNSTTPNISLAAFIGLVLAMTLADSVSLTVTATKSLADFLASCWDQQMKF